MPISTEYDQQFLPHRRVFLNESENPAPVRVVRPLSVERFETLNVPTTQYSKTWTSKQMALFAALMFGLTIVAVGVTGGVLAIVITRMNTTAVCNPSCLNGGTCAATNTCACDSSMWSGSYCQTPVRIFWGFEGTLQDLYNNFNGNGNNGVTYFSPDYSGVGSCLWLNRSASTSVTVSSPPFLNVVNISFTFEMWIYPRTLCSVSPCTDNAILGQYEQNSTDRTFYITVRNQHIYFGFTFDDAVGTQTLIANQWYHIACVYDYATRTQYIYVNGYLDVSRSSAGPYQGATGSLTIGTNVINSGNNFFDGYLDSMSYVARAKSATEVLDDATLVAKLSFDGNSLLDLGPLTNNGTGIYYQYTSSGRVNEAITLSGLLSYVQITGLLRMGTVGWPYTTAIWTRPTAISGGTIMHLSGRTDGAQTNSWCLPIMGLTSSGLIAINSWNGGNVAINGPSAPLLAWTHVAATYSSTNGQRLYINGSQYGSSSSVYTFSASGTRMTITLGSSLVGIAGCNTGTIQMGQYTGSLDEFQLYSRELTAAQVFALANP